MPPDELPEWVIRQGIIRWQEDHPDCRCSEEDICRFMQAQHPTRDCPLRTDCGGWTFDPPCGGCDRCIVDQIIYYQMKERERTAS